MSFTDDTSLDQRTTSAKVSIHCQVLRDHPLDWYYLLLQRSPVKSGELKSAVVTHTFHQLSDSDKKRVLSTLRLVRVNITDPRPYYSDFYKHIEQRLPGVDGRDFLEQMERAQNEAAERFRRLYREHLASQILLDSPSHRFAHLYRAMTSLLEFPLEAKSDLPYCTRNPGLDFTDLPSFQDKKRLINVNKVSVFVSKSGSVFNPAFDELLDAGRRHGWHVPFLHSWGALLALKDAHAFDEGNRKALKWVHDQRNNVLASVNPPFLLKFIGPPKPLTAIDSGTSYFIQAADIAAGIVASLWDRASLVSVVRAFDHVCYNGKRVGETEAQVIAGVLQRANSPSPHSAR